MNKARLLERLGLMHQPLLQKVKRTACVLIELYEGPETESLPEDICAWGLESGLIGLREADYCHMVLTKPPSELDRLDDDVL